MSRRLLFMAKKRGVYDSFNRANAPTMGRADTGQLWYNLIGQSGIIDQQAYLINSGSGVAMIDAGFSDCMVSCDITHDLTYALNSMATGLEIKSSSSLNRIVACLYGVSPSPVVLGVEKIINGTSTLLVDKVVSISTLPAYNFKIRCAGTSYSFYFNDVLIHELTIAEFQGNTVFGIFKNNPTNYARFDNFSVEPI